MKEDGLYIGIPLESGIFRAIRQHNVFNTIETELQDILDSKFNFQDENFDLISSDIERFCDLWLNPKTRKLAKLLYL